jgi:hypothetical protein
MVNPTPRQQDLVMANAFLLSLPPLIEQYRQDPDPDSPQVVEYLTSLMEDVSGWLKDPDNAEREAQVRRSMEEFTALTRLAVQAARREQN